MDRAAGSRRAVVDLAGRALRRLDELIHRAHVQHRRVHGEDERKAAGEADGREILRRVVGELLVERRIERISARITEQQRIAIGRAARDFTRPDRGAGAGPVLHHHRLPELRRERLRHRARHHVEAAAGRLRHDQPQWTTGSSARRRNPRAKPRRRSRRAPQQAQRAWLLLEKSARLSERRLYGVNSLR